MSIEIRDLRFSYSQDRTEILSGLCGTFESGQITLLTGPSGCGKSTLLYLAAGLYPHYTGCLHAGSVTIDGQAAADLPPQERCRLVAMMFQNPELQFCMDTVRNELIFCLENLGEAPASMEDRIDRALDFCAIPHLKHRTLHTLSGGEKQKVILACAVLLQPRWLLLDEPFANIDEDSARSIASKLRRLRDELGVSILAVDHRPEYWTNIANRICILENGQLRETVWTPSTSYAPNLPPPCPGGTVLELRDLSVRLDGIPILQSVNAVFRRGMIYAVTGSSGSGKSTLFGALSGLHPHTGQILLEGTEQRRLRKKDLGKIGFVTQSPQDQFVGGTVRQEILVSLRRDPKALETSEQILRGIGLWRYRDVSPYLLSQGQQRRLGVAALLAYPCRVLICDEPTYAQDYANTKALMDSLCGQARERQIALIFSTHDRQLALDYADEILELREGTLYAASESRH